MAVGRLETHNSIPLNTANTNVAKLVPDVVQTPVCARGVARVTSRIRLPSGKEVTGGNTGAAGVLDDLGYEGEVGVLDGGVRVRGGGRAGWVGDGEGQGGEGGEEGEEFHFDCWDDGWVLGETLVNRIDDVPVKRR